MIPGGQQHLAPDTATVRHSPAGYLPVKRQLGQVPEQLDVIDHRHIRTRGPPSSAPPGHGTCMA